MFLSETSSLQNVRFYIFPCTVVILSNVYKCFCLLWKNWSYSSLKQRHSLIQWNPSRPKQCHIIRLYLWGDKNEENNFKKTMTNAEIIRFVRLINCLVSTTVLDVFDFFVYAKYDSRRLLKNSRGTCADWSDISDNRNSILYLFIFIISLQSQ